MNPRLLAATAAAVLTVAAAAAAANPHHTISGPFDPVTLAAVSPAYGDQIVFSVSTDEAKPWVENLCYVDGTFTYNSDGTIAFTSGGGSLSLVYNGVRGYFPGYYRDQTFTLGPTPKWEAAGGISASCTATLFITRNGHRHVLDTVDYSTA